MRRCSSAHQLLLVPLTFSIITSSQTDAVDAASDEAEAMHLVMTERLTLT